MVTFGNGAPRSLRYEDAGLNELRRDGLHLVLGVMVAMSLLLLFAVGAFIEKLDQTPALLGVGLALLAGVTHHLSTRRMRLSLVVLVAGWLALIAVSVVVYPDRPVMVMLAVPILIATILLDTWSGITTTLTASGLIIAISIQQPGVDLANTLMLTLGLGGLVLVLSAALWRSFYTVLDWSWTSYAAAQKLTAELRERQGELAGLNQNLVRAYERLEQVTAQLERARQAAEEARRLKSEFAANVSHELRTPLNLIIGLSELMVVTPLANAPRLPDVYRADVEAIYRNACHISNLIDDVLDLSQVDAHRMGLIREWTSVRDIIAQATATVRTLFEKTGLWLEVHLAPDVPSVFVDPVRIRQILINLLNNAVRFTEVGGVTIDAREEEGQLVISVADTGSGIALEDLPRVFQEFWRADEPMRGRRGSGLGLAVSKRFAELHGGNLWATSTLGRGSTFFLALPLGEKEVVQETELAAPLWHRIEQHASANPTILLVEPQAEALRVFGRYLDGYQVIVTPDTSSTARLAAESPIQAIIVGDPSRRDAIRQVLKRGRVSHSAVGFPIITCTLRTSKTIAQELGVLDYLVKPITQQQLQYALRRLGRGLRDLVLVDDDPEMLHLLTRMIGALAPRCQVRTATDGMQALHLLGVRPPQGLVLDLLMPGLDGYRVLQRVKQDPQLSATKVVVITARGAEDDGLVADALEISQEGGLHVSDLVRWIRAGLDARRPPTSAEGASALPAAPLA